MFSIHPNTFAARYVDLRAATADYVLTEKEVDDLVAPHYREAWTDKDYLGSLVRLSQDSYVDGSGKKVEVEPAAQKALQSVLSWE